MDTDSSYCPHCNQLKLRNAKSITAPAEGHWTWRTLPICVACGKASDFVADLPYGSRYDGEKLCADCIREFVDSAIDKRREARNEH